MTRLAKQIKLLEQQIALEKLQLLDDYAKLKENLSTRPSLLKGFLWGLSLGYIVIAPKLKHTKTIKKTNNTKKRESSVQRLLLASLPGLLKIL